MLRLRPAEQSRPGDVVTLTGKEKHEQNQGVQELLTCDCPVLFHAHSEDEDQHKKRGQYEGEAREDAKQEQNADHEFDRRDRIARRKGERLRKRRGRHVLDHAFCEAGEVCSREDTGEAVAEQIDAHEEAQQ